MTLFPIGYGRQLVTMDEMIARYAHLAHPEFARRGFAWLAAQGGNIGIGGGWRATPSNTSAASRAGKSFHQSQRFASGVVGYSAWDLVARNRSNVHRSPYWSEVPKQGSGHADIAAFGVHANVNNEPWHLQCIEQDGYDTWVNNGRRDPAANYPLPGTPPVVTPPVDPEWPPFAPEDSEYGLYPLNPNKAEVFKGYTPSPADLVEYLQGVLTNQCHVDAGAIDGYFGSKTEAAVKSMQGWNGLKQDGRCGPKSWAAIDRYAAG